MSEIAVAAALMAGLGLLFSVVLAVAYRFLKVQEDPRVDQVEAMLPGTNCGACGSPGCRAFAERLVAGEAVPAQCTVSSPEGIEAIAAFLGVEAGSAVKLVARVHCAGDARSAAQEARYQGLESCRAAHLVGGGGKACPWGCLGLGDCERACTFGAITMTPLGLPQVDPELCTACGDCVRVCPRNLFELVPVDQHLFVQCASPLAGEEATALCQVACDGCGRCAADAPDGQVEMVGKLPVVHFSPETPEDPRATWRCPTGAIQWIEGKQFEGMEEAPDSTGGRHDS